MTNHKATLNKYEEVLKKQVSILRNTILTPFSDDKKKKAEEIKN